MGHLSFLTRAEIESLGPPTPEELEEKFDAIVGFFALHHMHELERCFRGMKRMLKPGGRVVFLEPNALNPLHYLQVLATPRITWQGDRGVTRMRIGIVGKAMSRAGLQSPKVERFGFLPPFAANTSVGASAERVLERVPLWKKLLPFQIFRAEKT